MSGSRGKSRLSIAIKSAAALVSFSDIAQRTPPAPMRRLRSVSGGRGRMPFSPAASFGTMSRFEQLRHFRRIRPGCGDPWEESAQTGAESRHEENGISHDKCSAQALPPAP